eukprot:CAMPEP_0174306774 /NCGR_PEP_ID=MMETSP0810-20121108/678_1 /TAXON_ID=73025 ORGANISM="Eutreptiella gymnastica-like, Strain CCMP1594" /NCGR_SAMPLE_ID=MMETSP0810 /ASSEMBLY_ACC=CAM_ASM_000659 /LENGTH=775 /DNA_ID=CAMNT_0015413607 /DNA_START=39 /DNA_END=2366 /DNA_ORIENTATION=-
MTTTKEAKAEAPYLEYLNEQHVPFFIDMFVHELVDHQPNDWRALMVEMLDRLENVLGKGAKAHGIAKMYEMSGCARVSRVELDKGFAGVRPSESSPPSYILRDPCLKPIIADVLLESVTTSHSTTSKPLSLWFRKDNALTVAAAMNSAALECKDICDRIVAMCESQRKPFFDRDFWYGDRSTMYPKGTPSDCTVTEPRRAVRATELYPKAPLFVRTSEPREMVQGALGDGYFVGAVNSIAWGRGQSLKPLERLFVYDNAKWGVYGVLFFKEGAWEWVVVDDYVAIAEDSRAYTWPQYAAPGRASELWPMLLEKAYAKVHGAWDAIDGGVGYNALQDLTGSLCYTLDLYRRDKTVWAQNFDKFKALFDDPLVIVQCTVGWHVQDRSGSTHSRSVHGLWKGHAYSVLRIHVASDGQAFVRVRNPWGPEAEWLGPYSNKWPDWHDAPVYRKELDPGKREDGAFWMRWPDFCSVFTDIDLVRLFDYENVCLTVCGRSSYEDNAEDGIIILHVQSKVPALVLSIGQSDHTVHPVHTVRKKSRPASMRLSVFKLKGLPSSFEEMPKQLDRRIATERHEALALFHEVHLDPGYYSLVPQFKGQANVGYYVRVVAPHTSQLQMWRLQASESRSVSVTGALLASQEVPSVLAPSVPTTRAQGDDEEIPMPPPEAPVSPEPVYKGLGLKNGSEFDKLVVQAFETCDRYQSGFLPHQAAKEAVAALLMGSAKGQELFEGIWEGHSRDHPDAEATLREFMLMLNRFWDGMWVAPLEPAPEDGAAVDS